MIKRALLALVIMAAPAYAGEPLTPLTGAQNLAYTSTSRSITDAIGAHTDVVRLVCTTDCWVAFAISGESAVANKITGHFMPADDAEYFRIQGNSKIHVIQDASTGTLSVTEVGR